MKKLKTATIAVTCVLAAEVILGGIGYIKVNSYEKSIEAFSAEQTSYAKQLADAKELEKIDEQTNCYHIEAFKEIFEQKVDEMDLDNQMALINISFGSATNGLKFINDTYGHLYGNQTVKVTDKLNNLQNDGKVSAFIAMDGDKFGTLKNQYGDEAVDNIVITLTDLLKEHFDDKENDLICNVGENSDELYLFLMNRNDIGEIEQEVADFMEAFRNTDVEYSDGTIRATCSAGIAIYPRDGSDFQTLYEAADTALYDAKEGGRDRYAVYAGE